MSLDYDKTMPRVKKRIDKALELFKNILNLRVDDESIKEMTELSLELEYFAGIATLRLEEMQKFQTEIIEKVKS